jgi:hypothetical protein
MNYVGRFISNELKDTREHFRILFQLLNREGLLSALTYDLVVSGNNKDYYAYWRDE